MNGEAIDQKTRLHLGDTLKFGSITLQLREASTAPDQPIQPVNAEEIQEDLDATLPSFAIDALFELDD